jgi:hypothetical protein
MAIVAGGPASAAWKIYNYPELGVFKEFPADPKVEDITYKTPVSGEHKGKNFSVTEDDVQYSMTVVDMQDKVDTSASIMGECTYKAEVAGVSVSNMTARIEGGRNAVYGRMQSTDIGAPTAESIAKGESGKDKGRALTACFFNKGRLYIIEALVMPNNQDFPNSPLAIRFVNSMSFQPVKER